MKTVRFGSCRTWFSFTGLRFPQNLIFLFQILVLRYQILTFQPQIEQKFSRYRRSSTSRYHSTRIKISVTDDDTRKRKKQKRRGLKNEEEKERTGKEEREGRRGKQNSIGRRREPRGGRERERESNNWT